MNVIKRDGRVVSFQPELIKRAISKAGYVKDNVKEKIAQEIANIKKDEISVEEIQDLVEKKLMATSYKDVAKEYIRYRQKRELIRQSEATNNSILEIISHKNQYVNGENSNKNPMIASTQRDYMAGEVSKDISKRLLLTEDIVEAHEQGKIHFHDMDYFAQNIHNCCLVNLADMLQNGTVISGTKIEKPHSFATACNIATQIMASVASNQYGGQSENLSDLVPFVDVSRQNIKKKMLKETESIKDKFKDETEYLEYVDKVTEDLLKEEIKKGVQTIQYQILTLMTTNGI